MTGSLKAAHPISRTCGAQGASEVSEEALEQGASRFRGTHRQAEAGLRHVSRDNAQPDSSPETSAFCGLRDFTRRFNNYWIIGRTGCRAPAPRRRIFLGEAA